MTRSVMAALAVGVMVMGSARLAAAQDLPVPGVAPARDVPGAHEMPDPKGVHKVVFDLATAGPKPTEVHPMLQAVARYVNTLAKTGVPASNRQIALVFHQGGTDYILNNDTYKLRHEGKDNPNIAIVQALKKAGVDFRVCGQAVLGNKIDPKTIQPEIQLDLWALTTIIAFQQRGYVLIAP
jgi:intracellular sulfur oxidation DsrE/DsrF family protein